MSTVTKLNSDHAATTVMPSTPGIKMELRSENLERVIPLLLHSPSSTRPSIWTTTVPVFLSLPLMKESMSSEEPLLLTENTSEMDIAPKLQSDAKEPMDTKSVPP